MACCAFALFLVGQIALVLGGLRRRLPRVLRGRDPATRRNAATAWKLHPAPPPSLEPSAAARPRRAWRLRRGWVVLALAADLAAGGAALAWMHTTPDAGPAPAEASIGPGAGDLTTASWWCSGATDPIRFD